MQKTLPETIAEKLILKGLSLAVYREVAAHLRQIVGLEVELEPQRSPAFDYHQSQIGAMIIRYPETFTAEKLQIITDILTFYGDRHGQQWSREKLS
ncbi:hypothetical protein NIES208_06530 [[Limnothrix rosea] IAM M-220]|nr:hypothetical protein NIES208_06530 [[Limnothrix rosea] IAM M-220]